MGKPRAARGVWVRTDRWPDTRTMQAFAADAMKLSGAGTGEEKAVALWTWIRRVMRDDGGACEGPRGAEKEVRDPLKILNVHGHGYCVIYGNFGADVGSAGGIKSRPIHLPGHTLTEYWYKDADGVERWHLFDTHLEWYVFSRDKGRIAGLEEIFADIDLILKPVKTSVPFMTRENVIPGSSRSLIDAGYFPRTSSAKHDWSPGRLWKVSHAMDVALRRGESITRFWDNHLGYYADSKFRERVFGPERQTGNFHCRLGYHDATPSHFVDGSLKDPADYPYYRRYLIRCPNPDCHAFNQPARTNGCGMLSFTPTLTSRQMGLDCEGPPTGLAFGQWADGAAFIRPAKAGEYAEFVYRMACPYVFIDAAAEFDVVRAGGEPSFRPARFDDDVDVQLSTDGGKSWTSVARIKRVIPERTRVTVRFGRDEWVNGTPSAYGTYEYLVKFRLRADKKAADVCIGDLRLSSSLHANMFALPSLQPGRNTVHVDSGPLPAGAKLRVTYRWIEGAQTPKTRTQRIETAPADYTINVAGTNPDDIRMVSVEMALE